MFFKSLKFTVQNGKNLASKDPNGKSDPYLIIWCGAQKFRTKTKSKTLSPLWEETFILPYSKCQGKVMEIECWDTNLVLKDEFMGEFKINVDQIPPTKNEQAYTSDYKLFASTSKKKKGEVSGEIVISFLKIY